MVLGISPELRSSSPIRVLVADDEPALRGALAELLAHEDGVVLIGTASDADEAIEAAVNYQPDVAFVDVKMPAGGGEKAARGIVRVSPGTRVIALSAFEDRPTVLAMLRAGAVGYLVKGTGAEEIVSSIERVMAGGTSLSPEVIGGIVQELTSQLRKEEIEQETRDARRGEIERFMAGDGLSMVFQPIMDLQTRSTVGMEALARFRSLPLRPPNEWFAEAVQLELGVQLELTTVRQALHALPYLPADTFLAVNCSHRAAVSTELASILSVNAGRVVVEITEHEAIEDYDLLLPRLADLRDSGVRVAIDDAGAGFASLRHTLRIAPDIVKLDISLTRDISTDRARQALAAALVSFAEEMNITVVAEGIETQEELDMLLELGVRQGQGFFLAEPSPLRGLEP
jgi:EAL domain-containing protein (putative c-di-GMP-specific phosphodiesterase class I)/AmiR/NasT family two-component response regulator